MDRGCRRSSSTIRRLPESNSISRYVMCALYSSVMPRCAAPVALRCRPRGAANALHPDFNSRIRDRHYSPVLRLIVRFDDHFPLLLRRHFSPQNVWKVAGTADGLVIHEDGVILIDFHNDRLVSQVLYLRELRKTFSFVVGG